MILRAFPRACRQCAQDGTTVYRAPRPRDIHDSLIRPSPSLDVWHVRRRDFTSRPARCSHSTRYRGVPPVWMSAQQNHEERNAALLRTFGPLSTNAKNTHAEIVTGKRDVLDVLKTISAQDSNVTETVRICFHAEYERLKHYTRRQRVQMLTTEKKPVARTALSVIWDDVRLWFPVMTYDKYVAFALCFSAVAEGLESIIKQWLMIDDPRLREMEGRTPERWRSMTLAHLVASHLVLEINNNADAAVHCFFEVLELAKPYKRDKALIAENHPITRISAWNATAVLLRNFGSGQLRSTSEHMYDRFENLCKVYPRTGNFPKQHAFHTAILRLHHPKRPSFEKMIGFFRDHADEARPKQFWDMMKCTKQQVSASLDRTEELLRKHHNLADADWIARIRPILLAARQDAKKFELV